jgi:carbon storage regulator CsrA
VLVLALKEREAVYIGDDICVYLGRRTGDTTRVAIEAPANVKILREKLWKEAQDERKCSDRDQSAGSSTGPTD